MSLPRLHLDYQAAPPRGGLLGALLLAAALGAAAMLVDDYRGAHAELERLQASRALLAGERRPAPRKGMDEELKSAQSVVRQLALPWATMVRAVEEAAMPEIALLQLQPEAGLRQLRLTAEARSEEAMIEYLRRLALSRALSDAHLASHQVLADDPQRPLQFVVLARLRETR